MSPEISVRLRKFVTGIRHPERMTGFRATTQWLCIFALLVSGLFILVFDPLTLHLSALALTALSGGLLLSAWVVPNSVAPKVVKVFGPVCLLCVILMVVS